MERDSEHGGDYIDGYYHIGVDMMCSPGDYVYAISDGVVIKYDEGEAWGSGNVGVLIKHQQANGNEFVALYGHIVTGKRLGSMVTAGEHFADVLYPANGYHLHFGIHPGSGIPYSDIAQGIGWGRMTNSNWDNPNGFVDPVNWITTQAPYEWDVTPPEINWGGYHTNRWYNDIHLPVAAWTLSDSQSGVQGYEESWDAGPTSQHSGTSGSLSLSGVNEGQHTAQVRTWDYAQNSITETHGWYGLDTTKPTAYRSSGAVPGVWYTAPVSVSWIYSDNLSDVKNHQHRWNGNDWIPDEGTADISEGRHVLEVKIEDNADNDGTTTGNINVVNLGEYLLDTVKPSLNFSGPVASTWYNSPQVIEWDADDATSGIGSVSLQWDSDAPGPVVDHGTALIPEGKHTVTVDAADVAGNTFSRSGGPYWLDWTPPTVSAGLTPEAPEGENGWYTDYPTLSMEASDPNGSSGSGVDRILYTKWGYSELTYTTPIYLNSDGVHDYSIRAVDAAGNSSSVIDMEAKVDKSSPSAPAVYVPPASGSNSVLAASWVSSDPHSGIGDYAVIIGTTPGGSDVQGETSSNGEPWAYVSNLDLDAGQEYYFTVAAKNGAGLWGPDNVSLPTTVVVPAMEDASHVMGAGGVSSGVDPDGVRRSENYAVTDTFGQFVAGESGGIDYTVEHGYWHIRAGFCLGGRIELKNFTGTISSVSIAVEIRGDYGTEQRIISISEDGDYMLDGLMSGEYEIAFKGPNWLRKVVPNVVVAGDVSGVDVSLINGDCNNDNMVSAADLIIVRKAYGSTVGSPTWDARADLNGDGMVSAADLITVRKSFGKVGDP